MSYHLFPLKPVSAACASILLVMYGGSPALAQSSGERAVSLEEVVVTARRKAENLQDVPASVQAFSSEALDKMNILNLEGIVARTPGMLISSANGLDTEIFIRGIGSDIQGAATETPIGIFIDGIYMSRSSGSSIGLFDLERVEVLKGPQSLRFGKNIVGGLVNYVTKKPTSEREGYVKLGLGDYDQVNVEGAIRGPISDSLDYSFSAMSNERSGFAENTLGGDVEDLNRAAVRGQLRFDFSDDLSLLLAADYNENDANGRWVDVAEAGDSHAVTFNSFFAPPIEELPGFVLPNRNQPFTNADPRKGPRNINGEQTAEVAGVSGNLNWSLSERVSLQSITAYRESELGTLEDGCGMYWNFPVSSVGGGMVLPDASSAITDSLDTYLSTVPDCWFNNKKSDSVDQLSQEIRLDWDLGSARWTLGFYYLKEDISRRESTAFSFPDFNVITDWAFAQEFGGVPSGNVDTQGVSNAFTDAEAENVGLFGEIEYDISDEWILNAGLRVVRDTKDFSVTRFGDSFDEPICPADESGMLPPGCVVAGQFTTSDSESWTEWLPSVSLKYTPRDNVNYYARIEKGYKAGGYTGEASGNPTSALVSFDPEFATAYELGSKLMLLDRRMLLNATLYYTEYEDLQTQQFVQADATRPPDNFVVNATSGTDAWGVEADFEYAFNNNLKFYANYAFTKCEFSGEIIIDDEGTDLDGNTCRRTPEHGVNVGIDASYPVAEALALTFGGDYQWKDEYFFNNENDAEELVDSEFVVNVRVGLETFDGRWRFQVWGKNITDELNTANVFRLFGTKYLNYMPPRTWGATLNYNF